MLQLPEIFERDIQGKTTHLVPLVVICIINKKGQNAPIT